MNNRDLEAHNALVFSYLTLRKAIGIVGIVLPFALFLGAWIIYQTGLQGSMSDYYYTGMRTIFVGSLWGAAFFLLAYKGYGLPDDLLADIACIGAVGITLFPTLHIDAAGTVTGYGPLHLTFGALFFVPLIIFSLVLFTRTDPNGRTTPEKLKRNRVYRVCGWVMVDCIALIGIYLSPIGHGAAASLERYEPVFWLEAIALLAFGVSWLTKGEAILQDQGVP